MTQYIYNVQVDGSSVDFMEGENITERYEVIAESAKEAEWLIWREFIAQSVVSAASDIDPSQPFTVVGRDCVGAVSVIKKVQSWR